MKVVTLTRKPLSEGSVVKNVLVHGTGAIHIDACRIASGGEHFRAVGGQVSRVQNGMALSDERTGASAGMFAKDHAFTPTNHAGGRFPANLVIEHRPGCSRAGVGVLKTNDKPHPKNKRGTNAEGGQNVYQTYTAMPDTNYGHADENGNEYYEAWACVEGCAVPDLNEQSGTSTSAGGRAYQNTNDMFSGGWAHKGKGVAVDPGFGDTGGAARYFYQVATKEDEMGGMPNELLDYLRGMISPEHLDDCVFLYVEDMATFDFASHEDDSVHAMIALSPEDADPEPWVEEMWRVLKPGAHLMLVAPDSQPTGHTGAIRLEDRGFEIRDSILRVQEAGKLHYVPKPSRKERHLGTEGLAAKRDPVLLVLKSSYDEDVMSEIGEVLEEAGVDSEIIDGLEDNGIKPDLVPDDIRGYFKSREVDARYGNKHPCLHPHELVLTARGYRPINEIVEGDLVYAADGKFHPVEHVSRHPYTSPNLYEISVAGTNLTTVASDNHPFLIWRPTRTKKGNITGGSVEWVEAKDIVKGDYTMTPVLADPVISVSSDTVYEIMPPRADDTEFWFLFGLYLAEGVLQRAGHGSNVYPSFTLHEDEADLHARIAAYSAANTSIYEKVGKAVQVITFDSSLGLLFGNLGGKGASTKEMHPCVWSLPQATRKALLEGYLAGDGGRVRNYWQAKTVSSSLASQVQLLAASVGYKSNLYLYPPAAEGGIGGRKFKSMMPEYQNRMYDQNMRLAEDDEVRSPSKPTTIEHDGVVFYLSYVQSNTEVPYEGDVVNLSVMGNPTFQTAVGMSHNTVKPRDLMARLMHDVPLDEGPVLDPFMGSGSAALSCLLTGHDYIGIEREEEYVEIADARVRYWDRAENGWVGADIKSEAPSAHLKEEREEMTLDDLFDF